MAAPSYATDLTDVDTAEATTNWAESTDAAWDDGGNPTLDPDTFIQNTNSISQSMPKTTICSLLANNGSGITLPTDGAYLVWQVFLSATALDTETNGGLRVMVGSSLADFYWWITGGSDFARNPYGGWQNAAVNPTVTVDGTVGTPSGTEQYIGSAASPIAAIGKGNPHCVDVIRWGRAEIRMTNGDGTSGYATFSGAASTNDSINNRWGLLQRIDGGYLWKGLMSLGYSGTAVDFRDSNTKVLVDNTKKVTANFNKIEVNVATSRVDWTNVTFEALGTVSKGRFAMIDNADVNISACTFINMDTFVFLSNGACLNSKFIGCGIITAGDADFSGTSIEGYEGTADTSPFVWNVATDPLNDTDDMSFTKGTASTHAMEFGTSSPTTINLLNIDFSGYNASNGQTDSTFYVARTTGSVAINLSGCTGNLTYKTAGATVTVTQTTTVTLTGLRDNTEIRVYSQAVPPVELAGIENATAGSADARTFSFSLTAAITVDIRILHGASAAADGKFYENTTILNYTIPASNTSIPVQQRIDRNYKNPA